MVQFKDIFQNYVGRTFSVKEVPHSTHKIDRPAGALEELRQEATKNNFKLYVEWPETVHVPMLRDCMHIQVRKITDDIYAITDKAQYHSGHGAPEIL